MALVKKIIKSNPREFIIKWTGSGSDTLLLSTLLGTSQTISGVPSVNILDVLINQGASSNTKITRNNQDVLSITGSFQLQSTNTPHIVFDENSGSDIIVNMGSDGTLILKVKKMAGYTGV